MPGIRGRRLRGEAEATMPCEHLAVCGVMTRFRGPCGDRHCRFRSQGDEA